MSAGIISYSGLRTARKVTLPSVEMWNSDLNILKDPPKSIHTRRIDKVGDTQSILLAQDESGDRICEMINVYARGVNPMVAVSYDNFSNNSGKRSVFANQTQASLPYKVENVRPPVLRQEDLLPLSRMPRNWFYSYTNPSLPGVVNESTCSETTSSTHENVLQTCAFTNKKYDLVEDLTAPKEAPKHTLITQLPQMSTNSRIHRPIDSVEGYDQGNKRACINLDKMEVNAQTKQIRDQATGIAFSSLNRKVVLDPLRTEACSARGVNGVETDNISDFSSLEGNIQNVLNARARTNIVSNEVDSFSGFQKKDTKQLQQNKRMYQAFSKKSRDIGKSGVEKMDTNKFVHKNKILCVARTNTRLKENFINPLQDSTISSVPIKDYLSKNVKTTPTSVYHHTRQEISHPEKTKGLIENPLHSFNVQSVKSANREQALEMMEAIDKSSLRQNILHVNAQSNKGMTGTFVDPFEESNLVLHNQKRTPLHSVKTNTNSPFTKTNEPEFIREQKRRSLLIETQTVGTDTEQLMNNNNSYSVQSTNAQKHVYHGPTAGSFEGLGSAVPVFDRYDGYQPELRSGAKEEVRNRTKQFFSDRYPTTVPTQS